MNKSYNPSERMLGKYTEYDGTIRFYSRVLSLINPNSVVLDLGGGRGAWYYEDDCDYRRNLRNIKKYSKEFIAADIDKEVLQNPTTTKNLHMPDNKIPLEDNSVDLIVSDYVLEHVKNPKVFCQEINRVLKKGGYFCARTPHKYDYVSIIARLVRNNKHYSFIKLAQPERKEIDTFETAYKLNTINQISKHFKNYQNFSFLYSADPNYFFGKKWVYNLLLFLYRLLPKVMYSNIFVFLIKD